jgi:hypothetical protein
MDTTTATSIEADKVIPRLIFTEGIMKQFPSFPLDLVEDSNWNALIRDGERAVVDWVKKHTKVTDEIETIFISRFHAYTQLVMARMPKYAFNRFLLTPVGKSRRIIFDYGGTLVDNRLKTHNVLVAINKMHGEQADFERLYNEDETPILQILDAFRFVAMASDCYYELGIISSHPDALLKREIFEFGIWHRFAFVEGGVVDKAAAIASHSVGKKTVYIGSTVSSMEAASAARVRSLAVATGSESYEELTASGGYPATDISPKKGFPVVDSLDHRKMPIFNSLF